ncbi:MarR family winged helix-turn-helix transcriptional regulator [Cellulomonas citrea]|uniref:MarR family winged helix-turn-helix transcriptional regulator n=1 Tax=Cellulomonas citrea TaxID=1909423 RepID=UPI00135911B8|nr:MarR family transcriptional regulator [Cellulomonas citrea]
MPDVPLTPSSALATHLFEITRLLDSHHLAVEVARGHGLRLTWSQVRALWHIGGDPGLNQRALGQLLGTSAPTTSKICARLEGLGYLRSTRGPDQRNAVLTLTAQGRAAATELYRGGDEIVDAATAGWSLQQLAALTAGLGDLAAALGRQAVADGDRTGATPPSGPQPDGASEA